MDDVAPVKLEKGDVVTRFFQFVIVVKSTGVHRKLFIFRTVGDENQRTTPWNVQVHETARKGNDVRDNFTVGQTDGKRITGTVGKTAESEE